MLNNKIKYFLILVFVCLWPLQLAEAATTPPPSGWQFLIAPYGWLASLSGNITARNHTAHFNIPFSEIIKHLQFGAEVHAEASHGPWTFMIDPTYMRLSKDSDRAFIQPKLTTKVTLIDTGVYYQLLSTAPNARHAASLELFGGARYLNLNNTLNFQRINRSFTGTTQLLAPIVGLRIKYHLSQKTQTWVLGNIGGFDVDNFKSTWEAAAGIAYQVHRHVLLALGYRAIGINCTKKNAAADVTLQGPLLGIAFTF